MKPILRILGLTFVAAPLVPGQTALESPHFEVASVRQASAPARFGGTTSGGPGSADPERITYAAVPMIRLLMSAYGIPLEGGSLDRRKRY